MRLDNFTIGTEVRGDYNNLMIVYIAIDKIIAGIPKNRISSSFSMVAFMVLVFIGLNIGLLKFDWN